MSKPKDYAEEWAGQHEIYTNAKPQFYPSVGKSDKSFGQFLAKFFKKLEKDEQKLKIERISNGFVVEYPNDNGGDFPNKEVFEYDTCTEVDKSKIAAMLYQILEWMDADGGRYDEERIQIRVVHGDKFECKNKKCEICKNDCT